MSKSDLLYFDVVETTGGESSSRGVVFANDFSGKSDFVLNDWGFPVLRPKNAEYFKILKDFLDGVKLSAKSEQKCIDELVADIVSRLGQSNKDKQSVFFMTVSFDRKQSENFRLLFSKKADVNLLGPVEKNFTASAQKFLCVNSHANALFEKIEALLPMVSCFEVRFGDSIDGFTPGSYSKERVFEEALIFANLAVSKKI